MSSINTRYTDRAKQIKTVAEVRENPTDKLIRQLRADNERLRAALEAVRHLPNMATERHLPNMAAERRLPNMVGEWRRARVAVGAYRSGICGR